jgi:hypothetical protein
MTAENITYLTAKGMPPIQVIDEGIVKSTDTPTPTDAPAATDGPVWYSGMPYDPNTDDEPETRLNLTGDGLDKMLTTESGRLGQASTALERVHDEISHRFGDLRHAETYEALKLGDPMLYQRLEAAEHAAEKAARIARTNCAAVARETAVKALTLSPSDQERAAVLTPLIERQVERARLSEVRDAFRVALTTDDAASLYLFATMLPDRLRTPVQPGEGMRENADKRLTSELTTMVAEARKRLRDTSLDPLNRRAETLKISAGKIESTARTRQRAVEVSRQGLVRRAGF